MYQILLSICLGCVTLISFSPTRLKADLMVYNAHIYTVDSTFSTANAMVIKDGKFLAMGDEKKLRATYKAKKNLDAKGKFIYPGLMDAHCHFFWYGKGLNEVNLFGTNSFEEVIQRIQKYVTENPNRRWVVGIGWDQNDWKIKEFPKKDTLDKLFPRLPIAIKRLDGHAVLANQAALNLANITLSSTVEGGIIEKQNHQLTGILTDNAMPALDNVIPALTNSETEEALLDAQQKCFAVGLTSVADAGLDKEVIEVIDRLQKAKKLKMRVYAMVTADSSNMAHYLKTGFYKTDFLSVRSFKIFGDGALGSRGACLISPYHDKAHHTGYLLQSPEVLDNLIQRISVWGFQINTHCIGDSTNRTLLNLYGKYTNNRTDLRWRIEHAQVVHPQDIPLFAKHHIIPSIQPTHATSDMYWAADRLGTERVKTAYAYQNLLQTAGIVANGSDFPIEDISPLYGFHAAVSRQDAKGFPTSGFQKENALTRQQALKAMTIWAAYAQFEEKIKGSIEVGKFADFVMLDQDLMTAPEAQLRTLKVKSTFINGEAVYQSSF